MTTTDRGHDPIVDRRGCNRSTFRSVLRKNFEKDFNDLQSLRTQTSVCCVLLFFVRPGPAAGIDDQLASEMNMFSSGGGVALCARVMNVIYTHRQ